MALNNLHLFSSYYLGIVCILDDVGGVQPVLAPHCKAHVGSTWLSSFLGPSIPVLPNKKAEKQKATSIHVSIFQNSTSITSAKALLTKTSHIAKPKLTLLPQGGTPKTHSKTCRHRVGERIEASNQIYHKLVQ